MSGAVSRQRLSQIRAQARGLCVTCFQPNPRATTRCARCAKKSATQRAAWLKAHPNYMLEYNRAWRKRHPGYAAAATRAWRERQRAAGVAS